MTKRGGRKGGSKPHRPGAEVAGEGRSAARSHDSDRRPLRFWQPFNDWWRAELERLQRRPNAQEILGWYSQHAAETWKEDAPTLQETRVHAKCLRSLPLVRDYFRNYRAKKRSVTERSGSLTPADARDYRDVNASDVDPDPDYTPGRGFHSHVGRAGELGDEDFDPDGDEYGEGTPDDDVGEDDAVAAAGLTELANLRSAGSPAAADDPAAGGVPLPTELEMLHAGLPVAPLQALPPALASVLGGGPAAAAALWSAAAVQPGAVPGLGLEAVAAAGAPAPELLRSFALQHLQQQMALAALTQNLSTPRAADIGLHLLSEQAEAHGALAPADRDREAPGPLRRYEEEGQDGEEQEDAWRRQCGGARARGGKAARAASVDLEPLLDPRSVPKRRRTGPPARRRFGQDEYADAAEPGVDADVDAGSPGDAVDVDDRPGPSGRWAAGDGAQGARRRRGAGAGMQPGRGPASRSGQRGRGAGGPGRRSRPFASDDSDEAEATHDGLQAEAPGTGDALGLQQPAPLPLMHLDAPPMGPGPVLELLPREVLSGLSRELLVERVLLLQDQLHLMWAAQQLQQQQLQQLRLQGLYEQQAGPLGAPVTPREGHQGLPLQPAETLGRGRKEQEDPEEQQTAGIGEQPQPYAGTREPRRNGGQDDWMAAAGKVRTKREHGEEEEERLRAGEQPPPDSGLPRLLLGPGGRGVTAASTALPCAGDKVVVRACAAVDAAGSGDNGGSPAGPASTDGDSRVPELFSALQTTIN